MLYFKHRVFSANNFPKPFIRVTTLYIRDSVVGKQFPNFPKLFPNLRYLKMYDLKKFVGVENASVFFPKLWRLHVRLVEKPGHFNSKCLTKLLHANPQLKNVEINFFIEPEKDLRQLLSMLSKNSYLSKLAIWGSVNGVNASLHWIDLKNNMHRLRS